jgi:hypothetical protein
MLSLLPLSPAATPRAAPPLPPHRAGRPSAACRWRASCPPSSRVAAGGVCGGARRGSLSPATAPPHSRPLHGPTWRHVRLSRLLPFLRRSMNITWSYSVLYPPRRQLFRHTHRPSSSLLASLPGIWLLRPTASRRARPPTTPALRIHASGPTHLLSVGWHPCQQE